MPNTAGTLYPEKISAAMKFFQLSNVKFSFFKPISKSVVKAI